MNISQSIANQLRKPEGVLGRAIGCFMALANRSLYKWTLNLLNIQSGDNVFEIGFGPGVGLEMVSRRTKEGLIAGADFSRVMFERACKKNAARLKGGKMTLVLGDFCAFNFDPKTFHHAYAINVVYFWPRPVEIFAKIHRLLKDRGRLAITCGDPESMQRHRLTRSQVFIPYSADTIQGMMREAGFSETTIFRKELRRGVFICVIAEK